MEVWTSIIIIKYCQLDALGTSFKCHSTKLIEVTKATNIDLAEKQIVRSDPIVFGQSSPNYLVFFLLYNNLEGSIPPLC